MHGINASSLLNSQYVQQFTSHSERNGLSFSTSSTSSYSISESYTSTSSSGVTVSISESSHFMQKSISHSAAVSPPRQTPEQTAENILTPIKEKLEAARENGASDKELRSLLREGYKGFKQGFREAFKTLKHAGELDPSLKEELKETKHLVRLGFSELRQEFAPKAERSERPEGRHDHLHGGGEQGNRGRVDDVEPVSPVQVIELPGNPGLPVTDEIVVEAKVVNETKELDVEAVLDRTLDRSAAPGISSRETSVEHTSIKEEYFNQTYAEASRASRSVSIEQTRAALIEITTNDGDVVTVDIASIIQAKKESNSTGVEYTLDSAETSGYIVEGELDVGELKALDELLDQVDALSAQFFDGDVGAAFESALSIGFDTAEIASFSVALSESTTIDAVSAYLSNESASGQSVVNARSEQTTQQSGYRNLGDYVTGLQQAVQTAQAFSQPANLVSTLLSTQVQLFESSYTETKSISLTDTQGFNRVNDELLGLLSSSL